MPEPVPTPDHSAVPANAAAFEAPPPSTLVLPPRYQALALATGILTLVALVFGRTIAFEFVTWDDPFYISNNLHVLKGLAFDGLLWAFRTHHFASWYPLTWLSHMLDVELFGTWAGGHHLTSTLLHAANAILLFVWLISATRRVYAAATVAALWAVHPLRVESVAWISERKDLLCAFFFLLTLLAYGSWARKGGWTRYLLVTVCLLASLLAKSMTVTLPLVLLLLDGWLYPARRPWRDRLLEKLPWFAIAAGSAFATFTFQSQGGAVASGLELALPLRLANAVVSYVRYLGLVLWPSGLSALYLHPNLPAGRPWQTWQVVAAAAVLVALSCWAWHLRRRCPAVAAGWSWYLVMLIPVIGLVQAGEQALADRYTYLPQIGLLVAIVAGIQETCHRKAWIVAASARRTTALLITLLVTALALLAARQTTMWRDSATLFARSLAATPNNPILLVNLAECRRQGGDLAAAESLLREAITLRPRFIEAQVALAAVLVDAGKVEPARRQIELALVLDPDFAAARVLHGKLLADSGNPDQARREFTRAIALDPQSATAYQRLGNLDHGTGDLPAAEASLRLALARSPFWAAVANDLALVLLDAGRQDEAVDLLREALRREPNLHPALLNLAQAERLQGDLGGAVEHYRQALAVRPSTATATALGSTLRQAGNLDQAVRILRTALAADPKSPSVHYELALTLHALGDRRAAETELAAALALRPDWPAARELLDLWRLANSPK